MRALGGGAIEFADRDFFGNGLNEASFDPIQQRDVVVRDDNRLVFHGVGVG